MINAGTMTMYAVLRDLRLQYQRLLGQHRHLGREPGLDGDGNAYGNGWLVVNNTGSIQLSSGTLDVQSATLNLNTGSSVSGSGTLEDQGTLGVNTTQTLSSPFLVKGAVTGTGALTVTGYMTTQGADFEGPDTVGVASGGTWEVASGTTSERRHPH